MGMKPTIAYTVHSTIGRGDVINDQLGYTLFLLHALRSYSGVLIIYIIRCIGLIYIQIFALHFINSNNNTWMYYLWLFQTIFLVFLYSNLANQLQFLKYLFSRLFQMPCHINNTWLQKDRTACANIWFYYISIPPNNIQAMFLIILRHVEKYLESLCALFWIVCDINNGWTRVRWARHGYIYYLHSQGTSLMTSRQPM